MTEMTGLLFTPKNAIGKKKLVAAKGCMDTSSGNSLKPTTGRHSPMAGKPLDARIDPRYLCEIEPFLRLGLIGYYKLLQVVTA